MDAKLESNEREELYSPLPILLALILLLLYEHAI
jgi:hypothetical protein